jgi:hypothetical protein
LFELSKLPTDHDLLHAIYKKYYENFLDHSENTPIRSSKIYVPISVDEIASELKTDGDIVFGRLYYHLNERYGYRKEDGKVVHFFAMVVGDDNHCVNFPYVVSVLASLQEENRKYRNATLISVMSLFIATVSLTLSILL